MYQSTFTNAVSAFVFEMAGKHVFFCMTMLCCFFFEHPTNTIVRHATTLYWTQTDLFSVTLIMVTHKRCRVCWWFNQWTIGGAADCGTSTKRAISHSSRSSAVAPGLL